MKRLIITRRATFFLLIIFLVFSQPWELQANESSISTQESTAGSPITVSGTITTNEELYVVVTSVDYFKATESQGSIEKNKLKKQFEETAIPPIYYVITSDPDSLAKPKAVTKGQTKGPFAFAPFKYQVQVNKIKPWDEIPIKVREELLGSISSQPQWELLIYSHENKFGINTITKETQPGGGNARMVLTDYQQQPESWNKNVSLSLDKATGNY